MGKVPCVGLAGMRRRGFTLRSADMSSALEAHSRATRALVTTAPYALAALIALGVVLLVHGFLPGLLSTNVWDYLLEGDMRCLSNAGLHALTSGCDAVGSPVGYPFMSGGPIVYLGWALMETTRMSSYAAYVISGVLFDAVALAGAYGLLRTFRVHRAIALVAAVAYLISPTLIGMRDFGPTYTGIALLPALALADIWFVRLAERGGWNRLAIAAVVYCAIKTGLLFLDGYAFTMSVLMTAAIWVFYFAQPKALWSAKVVSAAAAVIIAHVAAVGLYRLATPSILGADPIAVFRSMGLDVKTLVLPTRYVWGPRLVGATWDHSQLWGDGTNSAYNYVGLIGLALAIAAVALRWRQRHVLPIAVAGVAALVLSFGPALKVGDVRGSLPPRIPGASYLMPESAATAELPWDRVYRIPGPKQMRATYRWSALTRFALVLLAALTVDALWRRPRRRALAVVVGLLAVVEVLPNVPLLVSLYRDYYRSQAAIDATVIPDLRAATKHNERIFFLSAGREDNDYLANYLASTAHVTTLNAGGDKNAFYATTGWPKAVARLARQSAGPAEARAALKSGAVDVVVAPYFHLRWAAYAWPPSETSRAGASRHFAPLLSASGLTVQRFRWFATLRLAR